MAKRTGGDLAAAEDALSDAFAAALRTWPRDGVPAAPDAWLLTAARRRHLDQVRRAKTGADLAADLAVFSPRHGEGPGDLDALPDRRLALMFVCAHPAIAVEVRAPLMLQAVLGLRADDIARCWALGPATMAQRLVRAKTKIAAAGIPFEEPAGPARAERLGFVLDAVYAALTVRGADGQLSQEAEFLAALIAAQAPDSAEVLGLYALCLYVNAAQPGVIGDRFVPLADREPGAFDAERLALAERVLTQASERAAPGRYQIEAAIHSAHLMGVVRGRNTKAVVIGLYRRLLAIAPSLGAHCGLAAALLRDGRAGEADAILGEISAMGARHQPYWVTRAAVDVALGRHDAAVSAYDRALAMTTDNRVAAFLQGERARASAPASDDHR